MDVGGKWVIIVAAALLAGCIKKSQPIAPGGNVTPTVSCPLIIDHLCTDPSLIPAYWIAQATK